MIPTSNSQRLTLHVFDFIATSGQACTDDVVLYERTLLHTFFSAGDKTIRAIGAGDDLVVTLEVTTTASTHSDRS